MRFEIEPYAGAPPIRFGMSESDVVQELGSPYTTGAFSEYRTLSYKLITVGLWSESGVVMHVAFFPGHVVVFRGLDVFSPGSFEKICRLDGNPMEWVGSIVLFEFGIQFFGFHNEEEEKAVAVFPQEKIAEYKSAKYIRPFQID